MRTPSDRRNRDLAFAPLLNVVRFPQEFSKSTNPPHEPRSSIPSHKALREKGLCRVEPSSIDEFDRAIWPNAARLAGRDCHGQSTPGLTVSRVAPNLGWRFCWVGRNPLQLTGLQCAIRAIPIFVGRSDWPAFFHPELVGNLKATCELFEIRQVVVTDCPEGEGLPVL